jgi:hypothetical protein
MKKLTIQTLWALVCVVFIFTACQKESGSVIKEDTGKENQNLRTTGMIEEDLSKLSGIPAIVSSGFRGQMEAEGAKVQSRNPNKGGGNGGGSDKDGDGIPDASDACPTQKETVNGYNDSDGCPDTAPPPTNTDSDGDGITNTADGCPTQAENFNGYQDTDGCPDVLPDTTVLPPTTFPSKLDLITPPVGYQGGEGNCVAFAAGYGARSIEQYYKTNATSYSYSSNIFSPEFVYNQTKFSENCGSGTSVTTVLDFLKLKGACTWQNMPYDYNNGCSLMPNATQTSNAANYKIASYSWLYASDKAAIKTMLMNKHAVIIGFNPDQAFVNAGPSFIWTAYTSGKMAGHAAVIVGYDDAKNAYRIMNSWGSTWGDNGYSWIDYDFLPYTGGGVCYAITGL